MGTNFGFTNTTAGDTIATQKIGVVTNYAKTSDEPTQSSFSNLTCPLDQGEIFTYRCRDIDRVSTNQQVLNPAKVQSGIEFGVRADEILRTTAEDGTIICDEPIVATLSIRAPKSSHVNNQIISQVVARLLGASYDETKKRFRWEELMRSSLVPTEN